MRQYARIVAGPFHNPRGYRGFASTSISEMHGLANEINAAAGDRDGKARPRIEMHCVDGENNGLPENASSAGVGRHDVWQLASSMDINERGGDHHRR
jgi:hypothetical protein